MATENGESNVPSDTLSEEGPSPVKPKETYQIAGYQKTACYGKCPVYQVKFYSDGKVTWYGKMNVERTGWYEAMLDENTVKEIREKAFEYGYFDFYNEYPIERKIADLPTTITYIRVGDMEKTIRNTHDGPAELAAFENYLSGLIDSCEWKPAPRD